MPLVPFLRLVHLRVPGPSPVLGGRRRLDDTGIHDGPFPEPQSLGLQMGVDFLEQPMPQAVLLQKMADVENRGLAGYRFRLPQPHGPPDRFGLVEQILHARTAEVVEQLHTVNPQHHRHRVGPAPSAGLGIAEPTPEKAGAGCGPPAVATESAHPCAPETTRGGSALLALEFQVGGRRLVHLL